MPLADAVLTAAGRGVSESNAWCMQSVGDEPITPWLVLVDPELAERVRATAVAGPFASVHVDRAPDPRPVTPHPQPAHTEQAVRVLPPAAPTFATRPDVRRRRSASRLATAVVGLTVAALLLVGLLPPRQAPSLGAAAGPARASAASLTLGWQSTGARAYLIEVYAGSRLVHTRVTTGTRFVVPGWLAPGRYTWRVSEYAGPEPAGQRVGSPLEEGWFLVE